MWAGALQVLILTWLERKANGHASCAYAPRQLHHAGLAAAYIQGFYIRVIPERLQVECEQAGARALQPLLAQQCVTAHLCL